MDEHKQAVLQKRIEKTMKALERNKMKPFYAKDKGEALRIVQSLLQPGQIIAEFPLESGASFHFADKVVQREAGGYCGPVRLIRPGKPGHFAAPVQVGPVQGCQVLFHLEQPRRIVRQGRRRWS